MKVFRAKSSAMAPWLLHSSSLELLWHTTEGQTGSDDVTTLWFCIPEAGVHLKQMHHYTRLSPEIIRKVNFIFVEGKIKVMGKGRLKRPCNLTITYRGVFAEIKKHFTLKTQTLSWCKKYFCILNEICFPFSLDGNKTYKRFLSICVHDPFVLHGSET